MSLPSTHNDQNADTSVGTRVETMALDHLASVVRAVAFWSAIALPFLYLPLLASGLQTPGQITAFVALLALNVLAVIGGRRYNR